MKKERVKEVWKMISNNLMSLHFPAVIKYFSQVVGNQNDIFKIFLENSKS
jgi:hypothetical protein